MNPIKPGQFLLGRKPTANKNVIGWTEEETKAAKETTASANLISVIHPSFPFLITSYDFPFSLFYYFFLEIIIYLFLDNFKKNLKQVLSRGIVTLNIVVQIILFLIFISY